MIAELDLSRFPWPIRLRYVEPMNRWSEARIVVDFMVKDVNGGSPTRIVLDRVVSSRFADHDPVGFIRSLLIEAVLHELDECITYRGERPFDPHRGEAGS